MELVQPALDGFENMLMLPARDPSLLAGGAAVLDVIKQSARPDWIAAIASSRVLNPVAAFPPIERPKLPRAYSHFRYIAGSENVSRVAALS